MRKILTQFEVLPSFLNLICAFGHPQHHFDVDLPFGYHLRIKDTMNTVKDLGEWWTLQSDLQQLISSCATRPLLRNPIHCKNWPQ